METDAKPLKLTSLEVVVMASASRGFSRLKKLAKEIPEEGQVHKILGDLSEQTNHAADRAVALVGGAFLEGVLVAAILTKFIPLDAKEERSTLFDSDSNGPLATFSARIRVSYALGLFGSGTRDELEVVKAIRNAFAHSAGSLDFEHADVAHLCSQLSLFEKSLIAERLFGKTSKERYISTVAFISSRLRRNILDTPPKTLLGWAHEMHRWGQLT